MSDIMTQHAIQVAIAQTQHLGVYCWNKSHQLPRDSLIKLVGHLAYYIGSYKKNIAGSMVLYIHLQLHLLDFVHRK